MEANEVATIIISMGGLIVTVGGGFFAWVMKMNKAENERRVAEEKRYLEEREKRDKLFTDALEMLGNNIKDNTNSNKEIAKIGKEGNEQSKERNGHLGEMALKTQEMVLQSQKLIDRNMECYQKGFKELKSQHVKTQQVDKQIVKR